ncbi:MAG: hypothetical protein ACOXZT_08920 [Tissierellaceae bacterium]
MGKREIKLKNIRKADDLEKNSTFGQFGLKLLKTNYIRNTEFNIFPIIVLETVK